MSNQVESVESSVWKKKTEILWHTKKIYIKSQKKRSEFIRFYWGIYKICALLCLHIFKYLLYFCGEYIIYKFWYGLLIEAERERVRERHVIDCSIVLTLAKFECPMFSQRSAHFTKESSVPRDGRSSIVEAETPISPDPKIPRSTPIRSSRIKWLSSTRGAFLCFD